MVFILVEGSWSQIAGVIVVRRLRRVAARDQLVALGQSAYWWVNRATPESEPLTLRINRLQQWQDVSDIEWDGSAFWVLRDDRRRGAKARFGLHHLSADGARRYDAASHYSLGQLVTLAQDPQQSGRLWLVQKRDRH